MSIDALKKLALHSLEESKAQEIVVYDVAEMTSLMDAMIICNGRSNRHVRSIAENLVKDAKKKHLPYIHMEDDEEAEWVIVDLGDLVIHVMQASARAYYNLEELWEPVETHRNKQKSV